MNVKQNLTHQPMVFRTNQYLIEKTKERAEKEMVSSSAICRKALDFYIRTAERAELTDNLPQF